MGLNYVGENGGRYLVHVGMLGGANPAIPGMYPVQLSMRMDEQLKGRIIMAEEKKVELSEASETSLLSKFKEVLSRSISLTAKPEKKDEAVAVAEGDTKGDDAIELSATNAKLVDENKKLQERIVKAEAEGRYVELLSSGKCLPAQKETVLTLAAKLDDKEWEAYALAAPKVGGFVGRGLKTDGTGKEPIAEGDTSWEASKERYKDRIALAITKDRKTPEDAERHFMAVHESTKKMVHKSAN
jgi:hypothetical protein